MPSPWASVLSTSLALALRGSDGKGPAPLQLQHPANCIGLKGADGPFWWQKHRSIKKIVAGCSEPQDLKLSGTSNSFCYHPACESEVFQVCVSFAEPAEPIH